MLSKRPGDLPNFDNPPVIKTVLSAQFEPLPQLRTAHLGLLWDKYRDGGFTLTKERPPLDHTIEEFPEMPRARRGLQLQTLEDPPVPRLWFVTAQGNELIQVQADRFIKNWRKEGRGEKYPRYEHVKASFKRDFDIFQMFLGEKQLGSPRINQCEVTYVNHILAGEGWAAFSDFEKVFSIWKSPSVEIPGAMEDLRLHARYPIPDVDEKPIGRLHVDIQPAFRTSDNTPMYVFQLTARGRLGEGFDFFDLAREWIVRTFAALTTPTMHSIWKRTDDNGHS